MLLNLSHWSPRCGAWLCGDGVGTLTPGCAAASLQAEGGDKTEYRVWNPFRSKLAAAVLGGVDNIHIKPGSKLLYLGGASGAPP